MYFLKREKCVLSLPPCLNMMDTSVYRCIHYSTKNHTCIRYGIYTTRARMILAVKKVMCGQILAAYKLCSIPRIHLMVFVFSFFVSSTLCCIRVSLLYLATNEALLKNPCLPFPFGRLVAFSKLLLGKREKNRRKCC